MRENPLPPPRPPNKEIIEHENKRKIESQLFILARELRADAEKNYSEEEITKMVQESREMLYQKLKDAPLTGAQSKH